MGFTMHSHYCMDRLMDSALFGEAETCMGEYAMDMDMEMECCEDLEEAIETDETSMVKVLEMPNVSNALIATILWVVNDQFPTNNFQLGNSYVDPPPLIRDIPVEVQSFRI